MKNLIGAYNQDKSKFREILELILLFLVMLLIFRYLLISVRVTGSSMYPSYVDGERGIMLRSNPINKVKLGNVVVIKLKKADGTKERIVKRVIAMPNDTLEIKDNVVYVNNIKTEDLKRAPTSITSDYPLITLQDDEIFVLGDNREHSSDSRVIGPVKLKNVEAVHGFIFWPLDKIGLMK